LILELPRAEIDQREVQSACVVDLIDEARTNPPQDLPDLREEARQDVFEYLEILYNLKRKHVGNGMLSPVEFERQRQMQPDSVYEARGHSGHASSLTLNLDRDFNRIRVRGFVRPGPPPSFPSDEIDQVPRSCLLRSARCGQKRLDCRARAFSP